MLQRESGDRPLRTYGFLVAAETDRDIHLKIKDAIADALTWIEGVGKVEIDDLGSWLDEDEPNDQWENEGGAVDNLLNPKRRWND